MTQAAAAREYGLALGNHGMAHIVKAWKPQKDGYTDRPYVTVCGTAGNAYWVYTDATRLSISVCPRCQAKDQNR
jgi:hypothetical protein